MYVSSLRANVCKCEWNKFPLLLETMYHKGNLITWIYPSSLVSISSFKEENNWVEICKSKILAKLIARCHDFTCGFITIIIILKGYPVEQHHSFNSCLWNPSSSILQNTHQSIPLTRMCCEYIFGFFFIMQCLFVLSRGVKMRERTFFHCS